jgi:hypothetical protein
MSDQAKTYKPTHLAYVVREFKTKDGEAKSDWKEIGAAWAHKDGKGYDVQLEAVPVNGRIALRVNEPKPKAD